MGWSLRLDRWHWADPERTLEFEDETEPAGEFPDAASRGCIRLVIGSPGCTSSASRLGSGSVTDRTLADTPSKRMRDGPSLCRPPDPGG